MTIELKINRIESKKVPDRTNKNGKKSRKSKWIKTHYMDGKTVYII